MNEQIRAEFEQEFLPPHGCVYNAEMDHYGWISHPKNEHPFNAQYETWQAAHARYAGSAPAQPQSDTEEVYASACELIEGWNETRRKQRLPTATEGSLIDGIASLLMMIDGQAAQETNE